MHRHKEWIVALALALAVAAALFGSRVDDWAHTDPKGSLLSAQALLETGSFDLSPYRDRIDLYSWQYLRSGERIFYAYPYGTTLLHLPAVWLANRFGMDLADAHSEAQLNRLLAALSVALVFLLSFFLSRRFNGFGPSLVLALLLTLGTGACSTLGLALWNLNYAVVIALALLLILTSPAALARPDTGWLAGILLFAGFAVRTSFALFILLAFFLLLRADYRQFLRAAGLSALLLGLYVLFSLNLFGQPLPGHYQLSDFAAARDIPLNLAGHLVSPSRGLFVFSPFLLVTVYSCFRYRYLWRRHAILPPVAVWTGLLLLLLSAWFMWWGGGGYGNRLLTETLPGWILLSAVFLGELLRDRSRAARLYGRGALAGLAAVSVCIHLVQGANNPATVAWHGRPDKDRFPEYFWNPAFPQFLASGRQLEAMEAWHARRDTERHGTLLDTFTVTDPRLALRGWSFLEGEENKFRWSNGKSAMLLVPLPDPGGSASRYTLAIEGRTYLDQRIRLSVNGAPAGLIRTSEKTADRVYFTAPFTAGDRPVAELRLDMERPRVPALEEPHKSNDRRALGFRLLELRLHRKD